MVAPEVVINAAAFTAVDRAEDEPELAFRTNADGAEEVAAAARAIGAPVIQISTDYVFDGESDGLYSEDAPTRPLGVYGQSKLAGEEQVRRANPDHLIIRTAWVYSPFGRNFVKTMMALARDRDVLKVVADQHGNPSSALDLADGLLTVASHWNSQPRTGLGQIYHLAGTGVATWFELAEHVFACCERLGLPAAKVEPVWSKDWPTRAPRPRNSQLDSGRFRSAFDYCMPDWRLSVDEAVRQIHARETS